MNEQCQKRVLVKRITVWDKEADGWLCDGETCTQYRKIKTTAELTPEGAAELEALQLSEKLKSCKVNLPDVKGAGGAFRGGLSLMLQTSKCPQDFSWGEQLV